MSLPKVSVIVPVYNSEKFISKCIESILSQTLAEIELILINDGSTDASPVICEKYMNADSRIKYISQKNQGVSAARNAGLRVASGEFIGFTDSDDYVAPEMYEILYSNAMKYSVDVSACQRIRIDESGVTEIIPQHMQTDELLLSDEFRSNYMGGGVFSSGGIDYQRQCN